MVLRTMVHTVGHRQGQCTSTTMVNTNSTAVTVTLSLVNYPLLIYPHSFYLSCQWWHTTRFRTISKCFTFPTKYLNVWGQKASTITSWAGFWEDFRAFPLFKEWVTCQKLSSSQVDTGSDNIQNLHKKSSLWDWMYTHQVCRTCYAGRRGWYYRMKNCLINRSQKFERLGQQELHEV